MRQVWLNRLAIGLILASLGALALIGINEASHRRSAQALERISQGAQARATVNQLLRQMLDAETGSRGYLLTGEARYLEPYDRALPRIGDTLGELEAAFPDGSPEGALRAAMAQEVQRKLEEMKLSLAMRRQGRDEAWKFVLMSDVGKQHMDAIRDHAARLIDEANGRITAAQAQVRQSLLIARWGIPVGALAALAAFFLYLRKRAALEAAGEHEQHLLQAERDRLEELVRQRTASLAELATHMQQVREDERGHLARELHDELGALLTAAKLDVARLKSRLGEAPPEVGQRLEHLGETLNSGIALKRRIIEDLRPSSLANLGLTAALEILAREFGERSGLKAATELSPVRLDEGLQLTVYRLVQESLTNVARHAQATAVDIRVASEDGRVEVEVRDDGQGFDTEALRAASHGLAGMRHRVEAAGGRLSVLSAPGRGTRVFAILPELPAAAP